MPDSQTWVNHNNSSLSAVWYIGSGEKLVLEISFHADNYKVSLALDGGGTSATIAIGTSDWTHIGTKNWSHVWPGAGSPATWIDDDYIVALSFSDFGISPSQGVVGVHIEFLTTSSGDTDFAGAYITDNASAAVIPEPFEIVFLSLAIFTYLTRRRR